MKPKTITFAPIKISNDGFYAMKYEEYWKQIVKLIAEQLCIEKRFLDVKRVVKL